MNKTELLNHLAASQEERLTLSRALDQLLVTQRRSVPGVTPFLSPAERVAVLRLAEECGSVACVFCGGYPAAERCRCLFLPDWQSPEDIEPSELISAVRATWFASHTLTHRDFLGALMGLGIKREAVGDILVSEGSCDLLLLPEVAPFVCANLEYAGREKLHMSLVSLSCLHFPEPRLRTVHDTVPSLRLDAVLAAGFQTSRSRLADAVRAGKVTVNWQVVTRPDFLLEEGAMLSCRGLGKCRLAEVGQLSRKGRINVTLERYL